MTTTFDRSMALVLSALDDAREATAEFAAPSADDDVAEVLASVRLEMSVARASRAIEGATDWHDVANATQTVADAALAWLDDPVVQRRLTRMRVKDRAAAVTCRVDAAVAELRRLTAPSAGPVLDQNERRQRALRTVRSVRATLEDAVLSVRHAD